MVRLELLGISKVAKPLKLWVFYNV